MANLIEISIDPAQRAAFMKPLEGLTASTSRVLVPALNKTAAKARTRVVRFLSDKTGLLPTKDVRPRVKVVRADAAHLSAGVAIKSKTLTLASLGAHEDAGAGVAFRDPSDDSVTNLPHAFETTTHIGGHRLIFQRAPAGVHVMVARQAASMPSRPRLVKFPAEDLPIAALRGPSLVGIIMRSGDEVPNQLNLMVADLEQNVSSQVDRLMAGKELDAGDPAETDSGL